MSRSNSKGDAKHWINRAHVRIGHDVLQSLAWKAISPSAQGLYLNMRLWMKTGANGDISATEKTVGPLGYKKSRLTNALYELLAAGFIAKTRSGGVAQGSKVCNLYRFTDIPVIAIPKKAIAASKATFDFIKFETNRMTLPAIKAEVTRRKAQTHDAAKRRTAKKERPDFEGNNPLGHPGIQDGERLIYPDYQDKNNGETNG